jgi:hypothetical protein
MAVEVDELYTNLNQLLEDICKFLTDKSTYEKLSPLARRQADALISRSKQQLQEIEKVSTDCNVAYVDMEKRPEENEDDKNNIYSSVNETTVTPSPFVEPESNPYMNLPAKEMSQELKCGVLSWKCRIILRFEKIRRIYAGVHDNWLLVYSTPKDCKPMHTFNLKFHKAETVISKQTKKPTYDFELISTSGDGKSYYFLAMTFKDLLQWTTQINKCFDSFKNTRHLSISEDGSSDIYDTVSEKHTDKNNEDDEDAEYDSIETLRPDQGLAVIKPRVIKPPISKPPISIKPPTSKRPDLPLRQSGQNIKRHTPLPPLPASENDIESDDSSTYDPVVCRKSVESSDSFTEDTDEEAIYEQFVPKPAKPN